MTDLERLRHPRAIFLDIGGPIYDDENFVVAVSRALDELRADRRLPPVPANDLRPIYDAMRNRQGGSIRGELARRFLGDASLRDELSDRTKQYWMHPTGTLMPDVVPFLKAVDHRAVIGVVANQEAGVVDDLKRDGVARFITVWGVSALVGIEKPSPEIFAWALDAVGVDAREAVHIGNRLDTDVRPARAVGLGTVWLMRGEAPAQPTAEQRAEPDLAVESLAGLDRLLFP
ncbi:MAG TPA: HAD family hydrolase [Galbitalea sp.]|nr:HAD family hydrolase [Galbitalea sp.]